MRVTTQHATTHSPQPGHHCPPHEAPPLPPLFLSPCARVLAHHESALTPNPSLLPRARIGRWTAPPTHVKGRDTIVPPLPDHPSAHPARTSRAHANKPTPEREHASKQAGARGRRDHTAPPPQASAPTPKKRKHPREHTPPNHPPSKHTHTSPAATPTQTLSRPRHSAWAKQCKRGNPRQQGDRHEAKQAKPPQGRARRQRTQGERANNPGLRRSGAALRPPDGG